MRRAVSITALALAAGLLSVAAQAAPTGAAPAPATAAAELDIPLGVKADPRGHGLSLLSDEELREAVGLRKSSEAIQAAAERGDPVSMVLLGIDERRLRRPESAYDWAAKALKAPGVSAEARGRALYLQSQTTTDKAEAARLLAQAAEAGNALAQVEAAKDPVQGYNGYRFDERALKLMYQAAVQGYGPAQWMLGRHYIQSFDLPDADRVAIAEFWWFRAAIQGERDAIRDLSDTTLRPKPALAPAVWGLTQEDLDLRSGRAVLDKAGVAGRFPAVLKAAEGGDIVAMTLVALAYERGAGTTADAFRARLWAEQAAVRGSAHGMRVLARLVDAPGPDRDWGLSMFWRETAGKNGDLWARFEAEPAQGAALAALAQRGLAPAQFRLAQSYQYDSGADAKAKAKALLRAAADQGYVEAQFELGHASEGAERKTWLERAAAQGHVRAMLELAQAARNEQPKQYISLLRRAATAPARDLPEAGPGASYPATAVRDAKWALAQALIKGTGGKPEPAEAAAILKTLVTKDRDGIDAALELGHLYREGKGVPFDPDRALALYTMHERASQHSTLAKIATVMGGAYEAGRRVPRDYARARKWYALAGQDHTASFRLAVLLDKGLGGPADADAALEAYCQAAKWGNKEAAFLAGTTLLARKQTTCSAGYRTQDYLGWAAETGKPEALYLYGLSLYNKEMDKVGTKALAEAVTQFRAAGEKGHAKAQDMMAYLHYQGFGVPEDLAEAEKWARKSAAQNDREGQFELALVLNQRKGAPDAIPWLRKSAAQGYAPAQQTLAHWEAAGVKERDRLAEFLNGALDVLAAVGAAAEEYNRAREAELQNQVDYVGALYATGKLDEYYGLSGGSSSSDGGSSSSGGGYGGGSGGSSSYASNDSGSGSGGGDGGGSSGSGSSGDYGGADSGSGGYDGGSGGYESGSGDGGGSSGGASGAGSNAGGSGGSGGALIIEEICNATCRARKAQRDAEAAAAQARVQAAIDAERARIRAQIADEEAKAKADQARRQAAMREMYARVGCPIETCTVSIQ